MRNSPPRVALCGRPNVGKSTLFNRLVGRKKALVLDEPGVTRDVHRARVRWDGGGELELADLAGLELWHDRDADHRKSGTLAAREQLELKRLAIDAAKEYLKQADLVLLLVDARAGVTPADEELARLVRRTGRDALVVLSKVEGSVGEQASLEAATLGFDDAIKTSAEHNLGIDELKEAVLANIDVETNVESAEDVAGGEAAGVAAGEAARGPRGLTADRPVRLGVYGRPNVGKSTLVNALLGEKRMITSHIAGTTVDTVDTDFTADGRFYRILDTAGIRKKSKTEQGVEVLSVVRALHSLADVDVALFLIDGYEGVTDQDEKIAGEIVRSGKSAVLVVNKWDLCGVTEEEYAARVRETFGFLDFAPILFVSAAKGKGLESLWELIAEVLGQRHAMAATPELNRFLEVIEGENNPTGVKLYYASQISKNPPTIAMIVSDPRKVHFAYERFLKNELRKRFGWMGTPLRLLFRAKKRSPSKKDRRT
ncbi:MAG: ribosome biogenesis GTPase Der [Deltaproteobacteria bacterium]|nr:ribosome biogenesis GTPase Der [Deltaproteobacteria bacterium]